MPKRKAVKTQAKAKPKRRAYASADTSLRINAAEFIAWQEGLNLSNEQAARLLFVGPNTIRAVRAAGAGPDLALKCRAVALGITADDDWQFLADAGELLKTYRRIRH